MVNLPSQKGGEQIKEQPGLKKLPQRCDTFSARDRSEGVVQPVEASKLWEVVKRVIIGLIEDKALLLSLC